MVHASFKRITKGAESKRIKKSELPGSICLAPISIGQEYHVGDKGFATLKLLAESGFSKIIIIVVDELQLFTIAAQQGCTLDEARRIAIQRGDDWLEWFEQQKQLEPVLAHLPIEIIRWNIYSEDQIRDEKAIVEGWRTDNYKNFRKTLGQTAAGFLRGAAGQMDELDGSMVKIHFDNSIEYLKQETAVALKWQEQFVRTAAGKTIFLAYPKEPNPIIDFVLNKVDAPYKLEVEVLVIRFESPKLSAKKDKEDAKLNEKGEYLSSESDSGSPPESGFINEAIAPQMKGMQDELSSLREQVGVIPVLRQQLEILNQHVLFLYHSYVVAGASSSANTALILPVSDRRYSPPFDPIPVEERSTLPPPAATLNGMNGTQFN